MEYQLSKKNNIHRFSPYVLIVFLIISSFLISSIALAGGRSNQQNIMDQFLQSQSNKQPSRSFRTLSTNSIRSVNTNALVLSRADSGIDINTFNSAFSLNKTLTQIRNTSNETSSNSTNAQLLEGLFQTLQTTSKTNGSIPMPLQPRPQEANISSEELLNNGMLPTAIFNRFDLAASDGSHCGEYRIVYHKAGIGRFFLIFEAQYPNPQPVLGLTGCFAVADFWRKVGQMDKASALVALEQFFYQGVTHAGIHLPAAINFAHYTHGTGQVRSNQFFMTLPWQLREFKTDIDANKNAAFIADTVKDNPFTQLFAAENPSETTALKNLRTSFNTDLVNRYLNNILVPEINIDNPSSSNIINGISLQGDNHYNEFQSDSSSSDNTAGANFNNNHLDNIIQNKLTMLGLSSYTPQMVRNRIEAMSCGGCHQNSNGAEIAPGISWPESHTFIHVNENGVLSTALKEQFLPARSALLAHYLQQIKTIGIQGPQGERGPQGE